MSENIKLASPKLVAPFIYEAEDSRSLHFSNNQLQSMMSISKPDQLQVDYTKTMMGFLILNRRPKHIAMIGLGGGSLAKFCYKHLPETRITVIENNPHVIALREDFMVPEDNERFRVIEADGADFVQDTESEYDVLLVDGYDHQGQSPQLCTQYFYDNCYKVLADQGVLVVNLFEEHQLYEVFIGRLDRTFDGNMAEVSANHAGNIVVFAGKNIAISPHALRCHIEASQSSLNEHQSLNKAFQVNDVNSLAVTS
ncbi:MAG: fused MFS/spermidine synthase [Polynucleobacter sp.]|uniref:fused MFS/spermidine synthase n=1 Tax=Polynucleobacter sp. TaxID=2029855 RepID=UPI002725AB3F|nr:fused MFS/spermidine synthase [Polynucleobacter sp.]MDO8713875.1 fused MFS/spermidine synthase [Polynucleobacter sp.]